MEITRVINMRKTKRSRILNFFFQTLGILLVSAAIIIASCKGPKDYYFRYVVDVRYMTDSTETLSGEIKVRCDDPEQVIFTLSERLRKQPCLVLSQTVDDNIIHGTLNIACGVRSFKVHTLEWRQEVKNVN